MPPFRNIRRLPTDAPQLPAIVDVELKPPIEVPRKVEQPKWRILLPIIMVVAVVGMIALMFIMGGRQFNPMMMMFPIMMLGSMAGMLGMSGNGGKDKSKSELNEERKDFLRYLSRERSKVHVAAKEQFERAHKLHPAPNRLLPLIGTTRLWERTPNHDLFLILRVGTGRVKVTGNIAPPVGAPPEELEPVSHTGIADFVQAQSSVPDVPIAQRIQAFATVNFVGAEAISLVYATLAQLTTFHGPDSLRLAVLTDTPERWDWVKWLPHLIHPAKRAHRMFFTDPAELKSDLSVEIYSRSPFSKNIEPSADTQHFVVIVDYPIDLEPKESTTYFHLRPHQTLNAINTCTFYCESDGELNVQTDRRRPAKFGGHFDTLSQSEVTLLARRLAGYRTGVSPADFSTEAAEDTELLRSKGFLGLHGIEDAATVTIEELWRPIPDTSPSRLKIPIGFDTAGNEVSIDMKEAAEGGMGPHGLCIGATGSGKSEFLRTLVLSIIAKHSADVVNMLLIDFKGGATFLGLDTAPQVTATITDMEEERELVDRMTETIEGELIRRQEILRRSGNFKNVADYEDARLNGTPLEPLPALLIIIDEFSEMLTQRPELVEVFTRVGRVGRSLRVHLLLASQRLDSGRLRGLESHLRYRIALKTFSAAESREVLNVPDAFQLPAKPGSAFLKVDEELIRFDAAYVSNIYTPPRKLIRGGRKRQELSANYLPPQLFRASNIAPEIIEPTHTPDQYAESETGTKTLLETLVDHVRGQRPFAHVMWLPPLGKPPALDRFVPDWPISGKYLSFPIALVDRPREQCQTIYSIEAIGANANIVIVGRTQSGKSATLQTLILSAAITHTPEQIQFYCIDFGGGKLGALRDLKHVGQVAPRTDEIRIRRTFAAIKNIIAYREQLFQENQIDSIDHYRSLKAAGSPLTADDPHGDVFFVFDGWNGGDQSDQQYERQAWMSDLAARGPNYGVHVIISTTQYVNVHSRLIPYFGTKIELQLDDPINSTVSRKFAQEIPSKPGRSIAAPDLLHMQIAVPRLDGIEEYDDTGAAIRASVAALNERYPNHAAVPEIEVLPYSLEPTRALNDWKRNATEKSYAEFQVPFGLAESTFLPATVSFVRDKHLMIFGEAGSGKSTAIAAAIDSITSIYSPEQAQIFLVDYRKQHLGRVPSEYLASYIISNDQLQAKLPGIVELFEARVSVGDLTNEQLRTRSWWSGPEYFFLIDDYSFAAQTSSYEHPFESLGRFVSLGGEIGVHIILARSIQGAGMQLVMSQEPLLPRMREIFSSTLLLSGSRDEGKIMEIMPAKQPPGRGVLIQQSGHDLVQISHYELFTE